MISDEQAITLARFIALRHKDSKIHKYLPKNESQAIEFIPHGWVIEAIRFASSVDDPQCSEQGV